MASVKFYMENQENRKNILSIRIHEVLPTDFEIGDSSAFYTFQDPEFSIQIRFLGESFRFIQNNSPFEGNKHRSLKQPIMTLRHKKKGTFDVILDINSNKIKRHDFNQGRLKITFQNEWYGVTAYLNMQPQTLADLLGEENSEYRKGSGPGTRIIKVSEERKLDPFDRDKQKSNGKLDRSKIVKSSINLERFGIYLVHPNAFKRCENCVNYTMYGCSAHKVEVSSNHACKKFYSYRTFLGGGFSPR